MDNVTGRKIAGCSEYSATGRTAPNPAAFGHNVRPTNSMNGSIDPSTSRKMSVGRVDDCIGCDPSDVPLHHPDLCSADPPFRQHPHLNEVNSMRQEGRNDRGLFELSGTADPVILLSWDQESRSIDTRFGPTGLAPRY